MKLKGLAFRKKDKLHAGNATRSGGKRPHLRLCTPDADGANVQRRGGVALVPFKTLATYRFSFPFGRGGSVRDALLLNLTPITGGGEGRPSLSIVPQIIEQKRDLTRGTAWLVSKDEVAEWEKNLGPDTVLWPAPLAFGYAVEGSGLVLYKCSGGTAALWLENGEPMLYRWQDSENGSAEELAEWFKEYAEAQNKSIDDELFIDESGITQAVLEEAEEYAAQAVPGLDSLDLSSRWALDAERAEETVKRLYGGIKVLAAAGAVFVIMSLALIAWGFTIREEFAAAPAEAYRNAFGEPSPAPLASALKMQRAARSGGRGISFEILMGAIASAWSNLPDASDVKLDAVRYAEEKSEIGGLAARTESISALRDGITAAGLKAKTGEVQQVPGSGLRFSISVSGGDKR